MATKTYTINVKANTQSAERGLKGISKGAKLAAGALGGLAVAATAKAYLDQVNTFQELSNKIKLVTNGSKDLSQTTGQLLRISQETRQSFSGTADLYSKLALTTGDLNLNQDKLLQITQNVNKALAVSGSSTMGAEAAMTQLSQAFAGNVLRGEEFNSIMENAPFIIDLLAKELNVTRSEMRAMAEQGKITGAVMADALGKTIEDLEEKFSKTNVTVGQANQIFKDAFMTTVGVLDDATGASDLYTSVLLTLADVLVKVAGLFDEDMAAGLQKTIDQTKAGVAATSDLTAKMKEAQEVALGRVELLEAETEEEKALVKIRQEHIKREKEFAKVLKGGDLERAKKASFEAYFKEYKQIQRNNDLKVIEIRNSFELSEAERERVTNAINYQKTLDKIAGLQISNIEKEMLETKALNKLKDDQSRVEQARMQEYIDRERIKREELRTTRLYELKQRGYNDKDAEAAAKNIEAYEENKTRFVVGQLTDQFKAFGAHSKKAFEAYKALAIAQAIMDTYAMATASYKALAVIPVIGPALGFAAAAAAIATGMANVSAIRSQSYSGRQFGGPVTGGSSFIVGERSPEVFTPQGNGTITPLDKIGGKNITINFNIDTTDATGFDTLLATRKNMIVGMVRQAVNEQPGVLTR